MSTLQHPHADLSAYVDGALPAAERAAVETHLDVCAVCRAHVAELRATASLIGALPDPVPSRRLVPRLAPPAWLAPLRTLSSIASGVSAFLFVASVLLANLGVLSSGGATTALEAARQGAPAVAPVPAPEKAATTSAAPSGAGFGVAQPQQATPPTTQRSTAAADAAKRQDAASPSPLAAQATTGPDNARAQSANEPRPALPSPWVWLALALVSGALAIALNRRIHSRG